MTIGFTSYSEALFQTKRKLPAAHESVSASTIGCQINQNINQFWPLLSALIGTDLQSLDYPQRLVCLLQHEIGLWDVIAGCRRTGSLDSAIRAAQANPFEWLRQECPVLQRVCFNGKTSGKFAPQFAAAGYETVVLPSSSPANAQLSLAQKLILWQGISR